MTVVHVKRFCIALLLTTKQKSRAETRNITKRKWKNHGMSPNQNSRQRCKGKETVETHSYQEIKGQIAIISLHISIINQNINELNKLMTGTKQWNELENKI